jgi:hypothetical protein
MGSLEELNSCLDEISVAMIKIDELKDKILKDPSVPVHIKVLLSDYLTDVNDAEPSFTTLGDNIDKFLGVIR